MPLNPGTSLGPYQIVAPIGQGGPASVRGDMAIRELWRGLAEAKLLRTR